MLKSDVDQHENTVIIYSSSCCFELWTTTEDV